MTRCVEISTFKRLQKSCPNRNGEQQILNVGRISLAPRHTKKKKKVKKKGKFLIAVTEENHLLKLKKGQPKETGRKETVVNSFLS
jgi:hypothetical protein